MNEFEDWPELTAPVLVGAFEGWNDAGDGATSGVEHLELIWDAKPLAAIDPDDYYDFQVNRPTVSLVDGVSRRIEWPTTRFSVCRPPGAANDVVLMRGVEPNMRWRGFTEEILDVIRELGVQTVVLLGALLSDTPHTRPTPVTGSSYDVASAERWGLENSRYEGPTGILGILQDACVRAGIPAISFWAAIPHYVSQPPNPKATLALLHRVEEVLDIEVPLGNLPAQADEWETEVTQIASDDEEISEYIRALEEREEQDEPLKPASGESIAAEFERYLRRRGPKPGGDSWR